MSTLFIASTWCYLLAALLFIFAILSLSLPRTVANCLNHYPRNRILGIALNCWAWLWAAYVVHEMQPAILGPFLSYVPVILIGCAIGTCVWMSDLLACRATAGLLMLFPMPLILAVRAADTDWRLLPVSFGYISAIIGMDVMLYPWHLRDLSFWFAKRTWRLNLLSIALLLLAITFIFAGRALVGFVA